VAEHAVFAARLAGWDSAMVAAAVRDRLAGLASWHPDGTISAHPLVRGSFRPLVMDAAGAAAQTALAGVPHGKVASRADGLLVVEAMELLLEAGQWKPADGIYQARTDNGQVWMTLPAARLGQRAATAFVATPARRAACVTHLNPRRLGVYLNAAGLYALIAGDLATARNYLPLAVRRGRDGRSMVTLARRLQNLADCFGQLGQIVPARRAAAEALTIAATTGDQEEIRNAHAYLGWVASLAGDTAEAEQQFTTADQICVADGAITCTHSRGPFGRSGWPALGGPAPPRY
jgi:hypothetical protein